MVQLQTLLVLTCLCLVVQGSKWTDKAKQIRLWYEGIKNGCAADLEMSEDEILDYDNHDEPESQKEKCMLACVLTQTGIMSEGMFNRAGSDEIASFLYEETPDLAKKAHDVSRRCEKQVAAAKLDDECDMAQAIYLCVRKATKQMGIKY